MTIIVENQNTDRTLYSSQAKMAYDLHWEMKCVFHKVRKNADADFGYSDTLWDKKLKGPYFNEGEFCYTLFYKPQECPKHKFAFRRSGPLHIVKGVNERLYEVKLRDLEEERVISLRYMKHYKVNQYSPEWIRLAAKRWREGL